jgi:hypothetical protein
LLTNALKNHEKNVLLKVFRAFFKSFTKLYKSKKKPYSKAFKAFLVKKNLCINRKKEMKKVFPKVQIHKKKN